MCVKHNKKYLNMFMWPYIFKTMYFFLTSFKSKQIHPWYIAFNTIGKAAWFELKDWWVYIEFEVFKFITVNTVNLTVI